MTGGSFTLQPMASADGTARLVPLYCGFEIQLGCFSGFQVSFKTIQDRVQHWQTVMLGMVSHLCPSNSLEPVVALTCCRSLSKHPLCLHVRTSWPRGHWPGPISSPRENRPGTLTRVQADLSLKWQFSCRICWKQSNSLVFLYVHKLK